MKRIRAMDLFCGAGGSSWGAHSAGVEVVAGFDMWPVAESVYRANFPNAKFYGGPLSDHDPESLVSEVGKIDLIMASPECTNHSIAKGNKPRCEESRETALQVVRFACRKQRTAGEIIQRPTAVAWSICLKYNHQKGLCRRIPPSTC